MPDKPNKDRWSSLDWPTRAELIKIYVKHGITSASEMKQHYNSLEDPIFKDRPKPKADLYNRLVDEKDNRSVKISDGVGTHLMSWATVNDKSVGYSQIQPDNNGNLKDYGDKALDRAIERDDTIQFRDEKDADWWTSNNYKQFYKKMTPAYDEYRREKLKEKYPFYNTDVMNTKANGGHLFQRGGYKEIPPYLPQGYFPEIVSRNESAKLYSNDTDTREKAVSNIVNRANKKAEDKKIVERFDPEIVEQNNIDGLNTWAALAGLRGADFVFNPWVNQGIKAAAKPILGGAKRLTSKYVYPVINELGSGLKNGIKTEFIEGLDEMLRPIGSGIDKFANSKAGNKLIRNYSTRDRLNFISRTLNSNLPFSEKIESMYRPEIAAGYRTIGDRIYFDDDFYDKTGYILRYENPFDINHLMYKNLTSKGAVDKATKDLTRIPIGGRVLLNYSDALSTDSYPLLLNIMKSNTSIMPKGRKFKVTPTKRLGKQKMIELNTMGRATDLTNYHLKNIDGIEYAINGRPLGYLGENYVARTFGKEEAKRSKEALYKEYDEGLLKAVKRINKKIDDLNKDRGLNLPHAEFDNQQYKIWVPAVQAKRTRANGGHLGHITPYGQWQYPHQVTTIPSNNITMQGVDYPVIGISDTGDKKIMLPGLNYLYDGNYVTEYPINTYQFGGKMFNPNNYWSSLSPREKALVIKYYNKHKNINNIRDIINEENKKNKDFFKVLRTPIVKKTNELLSRNLMGDLQYLYEKDFNGANPVQDSYLLNRKDQEEYLLRNGLIKGKDEDYGLVNKATRNLNKRRSNFLHKETIPVYQTAEDMIDGDRLAVIRSGYNLDGAFGDLYTMMENFNDASMHDPNIFPMALYVDRYNPSNLYIKAWDLNDYTPNSEYLHEKIGGKLLDFIGSPTVQTTGYQKIYPGGAKERYLDPWLKDKGLHRETLDNGEEVIAMKPITITAKKNKK